MTWIKISILTFVSLVAFVALYISLDTQHDVQVIREQVNELRIEQDKIKYLIEHQPDTIILNAYVGIDQKLIQKR